MILFVAMLWRQDGNVARLYTDGGVAVIHNHGPPPRSRIFHTCNPKLAIQLFLVFQP